MYESVNKFDGYPIVQSFDIDIVERVIDVTNNCTATGTNDDDDDDDDDDGTTTTNTKNWKRRTTKQYKVQRQREKRYRTFSIFFKSILWHWSSFV